MIQETGGLLWIAIRVSWIFLVIALLLAFSRLVRGPSVPDRVVALDLISTLAVGVIAVTSIADQQPVILDAAIVVALVAFVGTVAFAYYVEKGGRE
ncbi:MAG: cation:proton antiporter [Acidobacteria bacterium]|nr:cation:proton antiporter [Acidobacteriota bacterium]